VASQGPIPGKTAPYRRDSVSGWFQLHGKVRGRCRLHRHGVRSCCGRAGRTALAVTGPAPRQEALLRPELPQKHRLNSRQTSPSALLNSSFSKRQSAGHANETTANHARALALIMRNELQSPISHRASMSAKSPMRDSRLLGSGNVTRPVVASRDSWR
jgi:hypothetical protein